MSVRPIILEIGVEEIPARFLPEALTLLKSIATDVFRESHTICGDMETFGTPRRLALSISNVDEVQLSERQSVLGPPKSVAIDADGKYTKAALGFAKKLGVEPDALSIAKTDKGEYLQAVKEEGGGKSEDFLPEMLKKIILSLHFPKSMRWGDGDLKFVRPIHWIVAMFGKDVISFELDGIRSGNRSRGHRFLAPAEFEIDDPASYEELLGERYVVVNRDDRVDIIKTGSNRLCKAVSCVPHYATEDQPLIVADLVEYPQAVLGSFDEKYLKLPKELLVSVMWGHQKYFSVTDSDGNLRNHFIIVSNTKEDNADTVRRGAERVIRARFDDARFYYEEDLARTLSSRVEDLKKVTFHEKLGSLHDKTMRVKALASKIADAVNPKLKDKAERAAELAKTDLITGVVYEFPELQGIMGKYYATNDKEAPAVATALMEQYLPAFSGDAVPGGDVGAIVGLADRMDNIAAFFSIGLKPTGSEDPFALRRQAIALIAILTEKGYDISLGRMVEDALEGLGALRGPAGVEREILEFIMLRLEGLLVADGHPVDCVQSVIGFAADSPLKSLQVRLKAVERFKEHSDYNDFLAAVKRVRNITTKEDFPGPDARLMTVDEEKKLLKALGKAKDFGTQLKKADYDGAIEKLLTLTGPINEFFDKVLVMDKDEKVKNNRLSLLKDIWTAASQVADFSKLAERE